MACRRPYTSSRPRPPPLCPRRRGTLRCAARLQNQAKSSIIIHHNPTKSNQRQSKTTLRSGSLYQTHLISLHRRTRRNRGGRTSATRGRALRSSSVSGARDPTHNSSRETIEPMLQFGGAELSPCLWICTHGGDRNKPDLPLAAGAGRAGGQSSALPHPPPSAHVLTQTHGEGDSTLARPRGGGLCVQQTRVCAGKIRKSGIRRRRRGGSLLTNRVLRVPSQRFVFPTPSHTRGGRGRSRTGAHRVQGARAAAQSDRCCCGRAELVPSPIALNNNRAKIQQTYTVVFFFSRSARSSSIAKFLFLLFHPGGVTMKSRLSCM